MLSKDGKLFGKISIIDISVILIFVLLIAGVYIKFSGNQTVEVVSGEPLECTLKVFGVRSYTVDALKKGGAVYDSTTKEYIGEIKDVSSEISQSMINMSDGTIRTVEADNRYNAYVTVSFTGKVADNGYYTDTNRQLAPGTSVPLATKYAECSSHVLDVKKAE